MVPAAVLKCSDQKLDSAVGNSLHGSVLPPNLSNGDQSNSKWPHLRAKLKDIHMNMKPFNAQGKISTAWHPIKTDQITNEKPACSISH